MLPNPLTKPTTAFLCGSVVFCSLSLPISLLYLFFYLSLTPSRAEDLGLESRLRQDFSGSSHISDSKIGTPMATLPGAWQYRVSTGTGRPGVSILWLGEVESWICNFDLSVAARKIVWADPSLRYAKLSLGRKATNKQLPHCLLETHHRQTGQPYWQSYITTRLSESKCLTETDSSCPHTALFMSSVHATQVSRWFVPSLLRRRTWAQRTKVVLLCCFFPCVAHICTLVKARSLSLPLPPSHTHSHALTHTASLA